MKSTPKSPLPSRHRNRANSQTARKTAEPRTIDARKTECSLVVIETHPVQYRAPVYRLLQERYGVPVTVIYGSDFSVAGYCDPEFRAVFAWDVDLLSGYQSVFLSRVADGGSRSLDRLSARGLGRALRTAGHGPVMLVGYRGFHRTAFFQVLRSRRPLLLRAETADHAVARSAVKAAVRDRILRSLYAACTRLLYIGRKSEQHFQRLGVPDSKLVFSPYCVDSACFKLDEASRDTLRGAARQELNVARGQLVLVFAGKLSRRKGADLLVAAVKALPREFRDRVFIAFLGSGELRAELESRAACPPAVRVHFCGFKNQTELSRYYHAGDLLVLPSRHSETWGLVVNEALGHGVPCVVSEAVGCAPDLIEPNVTGEIAVANSVESLAAAIVRAWSLVGRPDIRCRCRNRVSGYTVDRAAQGIAAAYQSVVS
jgi:glycosyltransferase involved in cell wall biosynthesis